MKEKNYEVLSIFPTTAANISIKQAIPISAINSNMIITANINSVPSV